MNKQFPDWLNTNELEKFLMSQIQTSGIFKRKAKEELVDFAHVNRRFRHVTVSFMKNLSDEIEKSISFIDEELAAVVDDDNERMLLWRPMYGILDESSRIEYKEPERQNAELQRIIDDILESRWKCQLLDEELQPMLKRIQADPLATIAAVIPRIPGSLKKEKLF